MSEETEMPKAKVKITALTWIGDGTRFVDGVPARDLDAHAIDRLIYVRSAGTIPADENPLVNRVAGLRPGEMGFDEARATLVESLTRSGLYAPAD